MPGSKPLDLDIPETNRVVVPGKPKMAAGAILARMRMVGHELSYPRQVGVGNHGAVEFHFDPRAFHRDLFEVPLARGSHVTPVSGDHSVNRAAGLTRVEFALILRRIIVKNLQFAQADVRCVPVAGVTNSEAVIAARRQL